MKRYVLKSYDVWGNEQDGYEVNDVFTVCEVDIETTHEVYNQNTEQEFSDDLPNNEQILIALKECDFLRDEVKLDQLEIENDGEKIYINLTRNGAPFCELQEIK